MKIAVLASSDSWYLRDLQRAARSHETILAAPFNGLAVELGANVEEPAKIIAGSCDLSTCDAVVVRTMPPGSLEQIVFRMDVLSQLEAAGVLVMNLGHNPRRWWPTESARRTWNSRELSPNVWYPSVGGA